MADSGPVIGWAGLWAVVVGGGFGLVIAGAAWDSVRERRARRDRGPAWSLVVKRPHIGHGKGV